MDKRQLEGMANRSLDRAVQTIGMFEAEKVEDEFRLISIDKVHPDPDQPRKTFSEESLQGLADTISKVGILMPITVESVPEDRAYRIISGERRYRAAQIAGLEKVPCIIRDLDDETKLLTQLLENLQREDLNPIERAEGIKLLMERFEYSQADVAKALGKSRSFVSEDLKILILPEDIKESVLHAELSRRVVVDIANEKDPIKQRDYFDRAAEKKITSEGIRREQRKSRSEKPINPYTYESPDGKFTVTVKFKGVLVTKDVILNALREAMADVEGRELRSSTF